MGEDGRVHDNVRSCLDHGSVDHFIRAIRADFNQTGSLDGVSLRDLEFVMTRETGEIVTRQIGAQRRILSDSLFNELDTHADPKK
jgi:hypothetical protein